MANREWIIPAGGEFRFEVDFKDSFTFKLSQGNGEVFGAELAPGKEYTVSGQKLAIFSFEGATVAVVKGQCAVEYVSTADSVPVPSFLQLHEQLGTASPPRVLILGSGRNTLARTLFNYALRTGRRPLWASLDVRTNNLFFPGTLSLHSPSSPVEVDDVTMGGGMACEAVSPFSLFFGSTQISDNPKLWNRQVNYLAEIAESRLGMNKENGSGGVYIVGPAVDDSSIVESIQRVFKVDWLVIIGNERLHARLQKHFSRTPSMRVIKLSKSGGVVNWPRPGEHDQYVMHRLFNSYFYGLKSELNPFSTTLSFNDFVIYRIALGEEDIAPTSALPLGATRKLEEERATRFEPSSSVLLYSIVSILHIKLDDDLKKAPEALTEALVRGNSAGYLYVTGVDESRKTMTVLCPCPGDFPSKVFLVGNLKWIE